MASKTGAIIEVRAPVAQLDRAPDFEGVQGLLHQNAATRNQLESLGVRRMAVTPTCTKQQRIAKRTDTRIDTDIRKLAAVDLVTSPLDFREIGTLDVSVFGEFLLGPTLDVAELTDSVAEGESRTVERRLRHPKIVRCRRCPDNTLIVTI